MMEKSSLQIQSSISPTFTISLPLTCDLLNSCSCSSVFTNYVNHCLSAVWCRASLPLWVYQSLFAETAGNEADEQRYWTKAVKLQDVKPEQLDKRCQNTPQSWGEPQSADHEGLLSKSVAPHTFRNLFPRDPGGEHSRKISGKFPADQLKTLITRGRRETGGVSCLRMKKRRHTWDLRADVNVKISCCILQKLKGKESCL